MSKVLANINKTVVETVKVRYSLAEYGKGQSDDSYDGAAQNWQWYLAYHYHEQTGEEPEQWSGPKDDEGNSTQRLEFVKKWNKIGHHLVFCLGTSRGKKPQVVDSAGFEQQVEERGVFLGRQMANAKKSKFRWPHAELTMMWKWLNLLDGISKVSGALPNKQIKEDHEKLVKERVNYAEKLKALLDKCGADEDARVWPVRAVYLAEETMEEQELRVFIVQRKTQTNRVMLVDWTNVDEPKLNGIYEGKFPDKWNGRTSTQMIKAAIEDAFDTWKSDNRYWKGAVRYELNRDLGGGNSIALKGDFTTGDTSWTEKAAGILKKIAMGAAMIGLILTGVGSAWAGAFIVTSMVAGTTGSVLSIHARHAKGDENAMEDALDVLDIISNVLGGGGKAGSLIWRKGATLEISMAGKVVKAMFIGQVWADGFTGILIGTDLIIKYDQIMSAYMTPDERARQLLELFASAAGQGVLHALNNKVTSGIEKAEWERLSHATGDGKPIRITDKPDVTGHTNEGHKNVTTVTTQKRQETPKVEAKPIKPFPAKDDTNFTRNTHNEREIDLYTTDGFHFNSYMDDDGLITISIFTKKPDGSQSAHLGTGRENFDRMFAHYKSHGKEINGWQGMLVADNFAEAQKFLPVGRKATQKEVEAAILQSVTGGKFWKPWADANGLVFEFEHATAYSSLIDFKTYFRKKK